MAKKLFRKWLKKNQFYLSGQGKVVEAKKVLKYLKNKTGELYDTLRHEITSSDVEFIDVPVWDDEFYDG